MIRLFKILLSFLSLAIFIVGCDSVALWKDTNKQYDSNSATITAKNKEIDTPPPAVVSKHQAYVDTHPISLTREPDWYHATVAVNGARLPFHFYITQLLGSAPVQVHTDPGVNPALSITMHYNGTVKGALAELAAKSNYFYDYDLNNNTITWSALQTKTFDISFIPGVSKYSVGASGSSSGTSLASSASSGSSGSSSSSAQSSGIDITQTGEYSNIANDSLSVWDDMKATIETLLSPKGKLSVSQSTTTITVRDHPSNLSDIGHYLNKMNKILSKQVHFDIQVLDVTLNKQFQYGIDWQKVAYHISDVGGDVNFTGNFATAAGGILTSRSSVAQASYLGGVNSKWATTNVIVNALQEQGKVSVVTQPSLTTLNDQVAQISIQTQQSYLASQTNTITGTGGLSQNSLDPGVVTYGFQMYILPKIQGDKVFLEISSVLSNLDRIDIISQTGQTSSSTDSTPSDTSTNSIQVPVLSAKNFNQRSVLRNGQTLVLAGYKRLADTNKKDDIAGLTALGSLAAESDHEELVVLITPVILSGDNF